jgi:hypothetical protein
VGGVRGSFSGSTVRRCALSVVAAAALAAPAGARQNPDVTPPPPPPDNFTPVTEAEVLAKLPDRERALVANETNARDRFMALLDVSDLRLAECSTKFDAHAESVAPALLLYESVLRVADQLIRSPAARVEERDKRYKQFEKRLAKQLQVLKPLVAELSYRDSTTGAAVLQTVQRLRATALNSALGVDILAPPPE